MRKKRQKKSLALRAKSAPAIPPPLAGELPEILLPEKQRRAVDLLVRGESVTKVAKAIGVDRGTLYRWRSTDPNFIAALNQWRGQLQSETRDRVLALSAKAVESVSVSIDGDARLGLRVLEKMGCLTPGPDAPVDPYSVFGLGLEDETLRKPIADGFHALSRAMTLEQCRRAPQLLALGIAIDNRRLGRPTPSEITEMAGPLLQDSTGEAGVAESAIEIPDRRIADEQKVESPASSLPDSPLACKGVKAPLQVKTHVVVRFGRH